MNVFKVIEAADKAGKYVRSGKGPYILEVQTYRYRGHSMSDPAKYRTKEELDSYKTKDPIQIVYEEILKKKIATKKELESATFQRLIYHLRERKDVQNLDLMNLAGFCRNCLSKWYREEAQKKGIDISDPDARKHIYGIPYEEWKQKYQRK